MKRNVNEWAKIWLFKSYTIATPNTNLWKAEQHVNVLDSMIILQNATKSCN